jgi:hypothetical protein
MPLTYRRRTDALKRNSSALSPCRAGRGRGRAPSRPSTEMFTEEAEEEEAAAVSCAQWQEHSIVATPLYLPCPRAKHGPDD